MRVWARSSLVFVTLGVGALYTANRGFFFRDKSTSSTATINDKTSSFAMSSSGDGKCDESGCRPPPKGWASKLAGKYPIFADDSIMKDKAHGTCDAPVQSNLRFQCDVETADKICCFNRHYAEHSGYAFVESKRSWLKGLREANGAEDTYYDSVTGLPLFVAPRGRTVEEFIAESRAHGWPSFRDEEVVWENVRCLANGEAVSTTGTHLGHNLPDKKGNRYCINLVSIAGHPK